MRELGQKCVSHALHIGVTYVTMQVMTDKPRLISELGDLLRQRREELGLGKKAVAERAGRVREVVYRLEGGEEASVSSLFDVLRALNLVMRIEPAGLPTMEDVAAAFNKDESDAS
jgi:transcriptional regulator with XRE-family HTH domain